MDVTYVNPFMKATMNVFKTMIGIEAKAGKPMLKKDKSPSFDISAIIGLSGQAQGSITLSFPKLVALKIVSAMLEAPIKVVGPEVSDGVGEIVNIVAGNAKQDLASYQLSISLPQVVIGKDHEIARLSGIPTLVVPFSSDMGEFAMEVSLKTG